MVDMSVGSARGLVQGVLGMDDEADASFRAGLAVEERMGYAALAARTRVWWAMLLHRRGEADGAAMLIGEAEDVARRFDLGLVLRDIAAMRS